MTTLEMEIRLARYYDYRRHIIVPNISWGMNVHECDLFIVSSSGYVTEIEIKVSKQDLLKDASKRHNHESRLIKKLYFAIPENLEFCIDRIPLRAGIIIVARGIKILREAQTNRDCRKLSQKELYNVLRLGTMRIWSLKEKIRKIRRNEHVKLLN